MFKVAVGHGIDPDSMGAIAEALEQCQATIGDDIPQAGILLAAIDFEHEAILHHIQQTYPDIVLIGGTSLGEMSSEMVFQEDSLTLMLFCSDEVTFTAGVGPQADDDAIAAAQVAMTQATTTCKPTDIKLCYALGDGLKVDGVAMVNGLKKATEHAVPIIGGLTADDWQLKSTYQFISTPETTEVLESAIVVLAFSGNLKVSYSVATGQRPIGPQGTVTKSISKTLYEIDGQPASQFYKELCGNDEVSLALGSAWAVAIAVYEPGATDFYIRAPYRNGTVEGSIDYFGGVPEKAKIQLTECDRNSLLAAAEESFHTAKAAYPGTEPQAALLISCGSRMKLLGTRVQEESELAAACLGDTLPSMGFYSYGELSPFTGETSSYFHNETLTTILIGTR